MKKFIAVLIAFAAMASGCGKAENKTTESTTSSIATTTAEVQTEETTISWEEARILRAEKLVADKEDFEALEYYIRAIMMASSGNGYDSSSPNAFANAMYMISNQGPDLSELIGKNADVERYGEYDKTTEKFVFEPDPLDKFKDIEEVAGYLKIEAKFVDRVLESVLCVTPDHSKTSDDFDYSSYPGAEEYYYYDGYYYYSLHEGGGGDGPLFTIGYKYNRDGSYTVKFTTFDRDSESAYDVEYGLYYGYAILEANASLKEVDGERIWAISNIKIVENIDQEK